MSKILIITELARIHLPKIINKPVINSTKGKIIAIKFIDHKGNSLYPLTIVANALGSEILTIAAQMNNPPIIILNVSRKYLFLKIVIFNYLETGFPFSTHSL